MMRLTHSGQPIYLLTDYPSSTVSPENAGVFLQKLNKDLVLMTPRKRDRFAEPPRRPQSGALTDYREEVDFLKL